jgi:hypothetical protein
MARIFRTPQISLPQLIKFSDCAPIVQTSDFQIARAYLLQNFQQRSMWSVFNKGPTPPPIVIQSELFGLGAEYTVFFNSFSDQICPPSTCNLNCTNATIAFSQGTDPTVNTTFCINGERPAYHFIVKFDTVGDREATPVKLEFEFSDASGNTNNVFLQSLKHVKPEKPTVGSTQDDGRPKIYVGVIYRTVGGVNLEEDQIEGFIIQRAKWPSYSAVKTFKGFNKHPKLVAEKNRTHNNIWIDTEVSTAEPVAYRTAFVSVHGEQSEWSDWSDAMPGLKVAIPPEAEFSFNWWNV